MYDILIPINKLSIRDQKIIKIVRKERETLKKQQMQYTNNDTQYNYYITREYQNKNVGNTTKPYNISKKRLLKDMRYKGFNFKDITKDGKIILDFS